MFSTFKSETQRHEEKKEIEKIEEMEKDILQTRKKRLFGTDGLRGKANVFPITSEFLLHLGQAIGYLLKEKPFRKGHKHSVLIGKDTRISGYMIEQALSSGLNSMGVHVKMTGPLPTPGISFVAQNMRVDAGIVISASHNPYEDNGVKIFDENGFKISHTIEKKLEFLALQAHFDKSLVPSLKLGRTRRIDDAVGRYIVHVKGTFPLSHTLEGMKIVLDCANGASYKVAPAIFEELGAEVIVIGNQPNGFNINKESGALFPTPVSQAVLEHKAHVGICLDGDGDRLVMVDEGGNILNGDYILAICAIHKVQNQSLSQNTIVATDMSSLALEMALKPYGIKVIRTPVGDKYVVEEMRKRGLVLGGEPSGHIIHLDHSTTGDGCVSALNVLSVMKKENKTLRELSSLMKKLPQVLLNTPVKKRQALENIPGYTKLITKYHSQLGKEGRVFIRYSGTEPVVRVFVEGKNKKNISSIGQEISSFLQKELN